MSLKDDLLRNRKIFELLTVPEDGEEPVPPPRRTAVTQTAIPFEPEIQNITRQSFHSQNDTALETETFSLTFGKRISRETGMALSPLPYSPVEFPGLKKSDAATQADPLEKLYNRLEAEARRSSQLLVEEEY